jgi:hypothetical protein
MYICKGSMPFKGGLLDMAKKSQVEKFREAAREAEADEDEKRFNERLKEIARKPSKPDNRQSEE